MAENKTPRYVVWDKVSDVITPSGEVFTPEQWMGRYPVARVLDVVGSGGAVRGGFFAVYDQMIEQYESLGCDFSGCTTQQEHLDAIEAWEDAQNELANEPSAEERIASALEYQNLMEY